MGYKLGWVVAYLPFRIFYNIKVVGRENFLMKGRCVGICNHYNLRDVPNIATRFRRKMHFVAKKELYKNKLLGALFKSFGAVPIDRDNVDLSAMKSVLKYLKDEEMIMLFPEGTRNKSGEGVQAIKAGAAIFAIKGKAPIVPMVLYKPPKVFRRNYLMVGKPFELSEYYGRKLTAEDFDAAGDRIYNTLIELKIQLDKYVDNLRTSKKKGGKKGASRAKNHACAAAEPDCAPVKKGGADGEERPDTAYAAADERRIEQGADIDNEARRERGECQ